MKPKWKTTEFWVQVLAIVATLIGMVADKIPPLYGEILLAAQAGIYTWSRLAAKRLAADDVVSARLTPQPMELREAKGIGEQVHEAIAIANGSVMQEVRNLMAELRAVQAGRNGKAAPPNSP